MKLLIHIVVVALIGLVLIQFMPWWCVAIAGLIGGLAWKQSYGKAFFGGFLGIFILWAEMALYILWTTDSPLPDRVGQIMPGEMGGVGLALMSAFVGGLVAGLAGLSGRAIRGK